MTSSKSVPHKSWIVSEDEIMIQEKMCFEKIEFPYIIELQKNKKEPSSGGYPSPSELIQNMISSDDKGKKEIGGKTEEVIEKRLILRHLEDEDLPVALRLIIREYGSYTSKTQEKNNAFLKWVESSFNYYENYVFTWIVGLGLLQRIKRRKEGDSNHVENKPSFIPDHNVICIEEETIVLRGDGTSIPQRQIIGMAELSVQPCNPERTSPPYVLPMSVKKIMGQTTAYVSNVLITNEFRGLGYSKFLMYTCEGIARSWGYGSIFLHVDASVTSGKAAQGLYLGLGYQPVTSEVGQKNINDKWTFITGPNMMNRGVYMVEGVPLLYLKKDLE